jgi:hypothetical protein
MDDADAVVGRSGDGLVLEPVGTLVIRWKMLLW